MTDADKTGNTHFGSNKADMDHNPDLSGNLDLNSRLLLVEVTCLGGGLRSLRAQSSCNFWQFGTR